MDGKQAHALEELAGRLNDFMELAAGLVEEKDLNQLCERILDSATRHTHADGGTIYRVQQDGRLHFAILRTQSLGLNVRSHEALGARRLEPLDIYLADGKVNAGAVSTHVAAEGRSINIPDLAEEEWYESSASREIDDELGYTTRSLLTVPIRSREGDTLGVLQLVNRRSDDGEALPFSDAEERWAECLAALVATAWSLQAR